MTRSCCILVTGAGSIIGSHVTELLLREGYEVRALAQHIAWIRHNTVHLRMAFHDKVLEEILQERVVSSRNRRNPRGVKRKMSSFPIRRKTDRLLPRIDIASAIQIIK
jgi:hypothetical protein